MGLVIEASRKMESAATGPEASRRTVSAEVARAKHTRGQRAAGDAVGDDREGGVEQRPVRLRGGGGRHTMTMPTRPAAVKVKGDTCLQFAVPGEYPAETKRRLAERIGRLCAEVMRTTPSLVKIAFRELGLTISSARGWAPL